MSGARGLGGVLATVGLALGGACSPAAPPKPALAANESWCPDGFETGPEDTCFAVPEAHGKDTPVLVYLHGMYAGRAAPEEWRLVRSATSQGFAVVMPRGKRGLCAWKAELADHFCWPHEPEDPQAFRSTVAEWDRVLWQVDALLEGGAHERYVLGVSNGASFAAHLATQGFFPARAYALVGGGALVPAEASPKPAPPMLLVTPHVDGEEASKGKALHEGLARVGWAHAWCSRGGDHALTAEDLGGALAFFRKEATGRLKPQGTSYACEPPLKPAP